MVASDLPSGTITFLFTDIQGSTQLWQQYPATMPEALERHHALLRQAIEGQGGYVFQIIGDAFCAAFRTARDGLNAAIDAQRRLRDEPWGETGSIRVRMALHSGAAEVRAGEYTSGEYVSGLTLSRAARLLSAGHGGQVLLSLPVVELMSDQTLAGIALRDLGLHRLKDLVRPERIFQAVVADLPTEFPTLKTLDARPHNLPMQLTSFIGREVEIAQIRENLQRPGGTKPAVRMLTLAGPGGTGKTRLALQVAANLIDDFTDGAWFVDLAPLTDPELVPQAVAAVWEVREQPWRPLTELLAETLRDKKLLLILDNCEHLVEACARLCQALLQAPGVKILATSREPLGIPGETIYRVPALSLPAVDLRLAPESLVEYEAVRLFIDRALAAQPDFAITPSTAPAVAQICRQLDGIPLAIELAAARLQAFSVEQVAARLADRFRLLTGGSRTSLPRQQTLRALIDWSYNLLTEEECLLFQRLSVFSGGWNLEAAEAACVGEGIDAYDVLDLLGRLVDRSLVTVDELENQPRYRLLETLRQYAAEALQQSGRQAYWQTRHLETYLELALAAEPRMKSAEDILWLERLEHEHGNLRTALDSATIAGNTRAALQLSAALFYFWYRRGHIQEGMARTLQALKMPAIEQFPLELANVLQCLGMLYWLNGAFPSALETLDRCIILANTIGKPADKIQALAIAYRSFTQMRLAHFQAAQRDAQDALERFQDLENHYGLAVANYSLGRIAIEQARYDDAQSYIEQALEWSRKAGDRQMISLVLNSLELLAIWQGDISKAQELNEESLDVAREINDVWMISGALREAGNLAQSKGEHQAAGEYYTESGELSRQQGLLNDYARTRFNLGYVAILQGDLTAGREYLHESREVFRQVNHLRGQAECLDGFAALAAAQGQIELAVRLSGAADAWFQSQGAGRWPVDQIEYDRLRSQLEENLGPKAFTTLYAAGQQLSLEQALELGEKI